jgi:predicted PurR-regulated permease PerM/CheY-like chemotaxis protein
VIAALYFGKRLVIPLTLAILLSFLLAYPATLLERLKLGRVASVAIVLIVTFSAAGAMMWIAAQQFTEIIIRLPEYQENIHRKVATLRNPAGSGFGKAIDSINQIASELSPSAAIKSPPQTQSSGKRRGQTPVPVRVVEERPSWIEPIALNGSSIVEVAGSVLAVGLLTMFILLRRGDLRNRLFRLFGKGRMSAMTTTIDDAATRVSQYLLTQSIVNGMFGVVLGVGLFALGLPYAAFWASTAAAARFIPYVGTLAAGLCPLLLSLAVFDGWTKPLLTLGLFTAVELTVSGLLEPWLYAIRTGISALAILISAAFWTMLWGPIGLLVSTPLTVLLLVLGRRIPQLEFLYILLGDEPVLSPEAHYYQRLLAMDEDEARKVAKEYLNDKTLIELYDSVLIPALSMAEQDRHENELDETRQKFVHESTAELIEDLERNAAIPKELKRNGPAPSPFSVLCIPARYEADALVILMLAQLLRHSGYEVEVSEAGLGEVVLAKLEKCQPNVVFISALPPFAVSHASSLCRKARKRCPDVKVVIALWGSTADAKVVRERLGPACSDDDVVRSLAEATLHLQLLRGQPEGREALAEAREVIESRESEPAQSM